MSHVSDHNLLDEPITDDPRQRAVAAAYCLRVGAEDVLGMLGLARDADSEGVYRPRSDERGGSGTRVHRDAERPANHNDGIREGIA